MKNKLEQNGLLYPSVIIHVISSSDSAKSCKTLFIFFLKFSLYMRIAVQNSR